MDPVLATGNAALHAIDVLVKHRGVDESSILFLTIMAAPEGIHKVCSRYPRIKLITSAIEESTGSDYSVRPGVGDFGDRYFGTGNSCDYHLCGLSPTADTTSVGLSSDP